MKFNIQFLLFSFFAVLPVFTQAQTDFKPGLKIHFFPLALIEPDGGIRAGAEASISEKFGFMADFNYFLDALHKEENAKNFSGFSVRVEPKFYFNPEKNYFGVQLQYKTKSWQLADADSIAPEQHIYMMNLKVGGQKYFYKNLGVDYYGGLGLGTRKNVVSYGEGFFRRKAGTYLRPGILLGASLFLKI